MQRVGCLAGDHPSIGRRGVLQLGGLTLLGTGLGDLLRLEGQAAEQPAGRQASAKSVVFIFQSGGPSQHETWDPKPMAPETIRGEYGVTQTRTAGESFLRVPAQACPAVRPVLHRPYHASCRWSPVSQRAQQLPLPAAHRIHSTSHR